MNAYDIVRQPRITEKSVFQQNLLNQYTFEVHPKSNKNEIKKAVESLFGVSVTTVKTMNYSGKSRRVGKSAGKTAAWKKAIITLAEGETIEGV
ncbi:MAG: 50S ribosomal protein L23 [Planctomycetes bacterium]|nr:50S ribosomal protein L23 [Planctomycetota bacterium]